MMMMMMMMMMMIACPRIKLVTGTPRFCHVTPLRFHLHWLSISSRIKFKILLLTFKCLYGQVPNNSIDLITIKKQSRYSLRSNESIFLELPGITGPIQLLPIVHSSQLHLISGIRSPSDGLLLECITFGNSQHEDIGHL